MPAPRLLLDEDVPRLLAETLRVRGHDAVHATELGLGECPDAEVLLAAVSSRRALLTHNIDDFIALARAYASAGTTHYGIVFARQAPLGVLLKRTLRFLEHRSGQDMREAVVWLPRG